MAKTLDFQKVKKQYLTITLPDEDRTTIMVGTPTKSIMDDLMLLQMNLGEIEEDGSGANSEATEELYSACARAMSRNKGGIKITKEFVSEWLDLEDIIVFFKSYMEFIGAVTNGKN